MKKYMVILIVGCVFIFTLFGCTNKVSNIDDNESESNVQASEEIPESYFVSNENYFDYQTGLECAAFSSAYLLRNYGEEASGMELFKDFPGKLAQGGITPYGIVDFFEGRGYTAEYVCDGTVEDLKGEIAKGAPVIVFIHVEEPYTNPHYTHYIPIVGYDKENFYFAESLDYLANGKNEKGVIYNRKTDIEKFKKLWTNIDNMWDNPYFTISKET
ncbi:hypothetical protein [Clostridium tertium]|uniref:Peptidase C39-like domain-containing protein n=1 Tax=Clostridium tertium TaxID=1559 RepID=A0A6N3DD40_9CLOT